MNTPDTIQTLFLRACKSKDPHKRVTSVYRRFYLYQNVHDYILSTILADIVEEFCPIKLNKILRELGEHPMFSYEKDLPHWTKVKQILISHIRLSHKDCFGNMRIPLVFRK
jgi:hypothetical protein